MYIDEITHLLGSCSFTSKLHVYQQFALLDVRVNEVVRHPKFLHKTRIVQ
jgi:hypothetical protein